MAGATTDAATPWSLFPMQPMAPLLHEEIPTGPDWGYQLKWDGVRILAGVWQRDVRLFSRNMLPKNDTYPELARYLATLNFSGVLDGEAVIFDAVKQKPDFSKILQRERMAGAAGRITVTPQIAVLYVVFDILFLNGQDIRPMACEERHALLGKHLPKQSDTLLIADFFADGAALWKWVNERGWEGIVSKKLSSPYKPGKHHSDWYKKKISLIIPCEAVGLTIREGNIASLVLAERGAYLGKVSIGLTGDMKTCIAGLLPRPVLRHKSQGVSPFHPLPAELRRDCIVWLEEPFNCTVKALERTDAGGLRHPQLISIGLHF